MLSTFSSKQINPLKGDSAFCSLDHQRFIIISLSCLSSTIFIYLLIEQTCRGLKISFWASLSIETLSLKSFSMLPMPASSLTS